MKAHDPSISRHSSNSDINSFRCNFVDGAFVEITGPVSADYCVQFIDSKGGELIYQANIKNNCWCRTARQYFTAWTIKIFNANNNQLLFTHHFNAQQQRVYIALESKALGDTLAWFHLLEIFRVQHACELICSTFMNDLFRAQYPDIQFVEPGERVENLYAMYRIGWFYLDNGEIDYHKNVDNFRLQALGESAAAILGIPYQEYRPRLSFVDQGRPYSEKYVCIAIHATAQAKYWNHPTGWQEVVSFLLQRGYRVVLLSKEGIAYMGNKAPDGLTLIPPGQISELLTYLKHAQFFIGIGSGLSWLAWASGCKTCLISGFSYPYTELKDVLRISSPHNKCSGCFNRYPLDANEWHWCPDHKDTDRQYECTRSITPQEVIAAISDYVD